MSFGDKPTPPDPTQTAQAQTTYNTNAAKTQNAVNSYAQSGPLGNVNYVQDPSSPSGYRIVTSAGETGQPLIGAATNLANNSAGMYSSPFDVNASSKATADKLNQWSKDYQQPLFDQQSSNLEAQLRNQGLMPGTEAYNNAKNLLARNQGDVTNQYLSQNQGAAYNQAVQDYQRPLQTVASLLQTAAPTGFQQTPTAQIQPANYSGLAQQNYQSQLQDYQNGVNNWAKLGVAGIGLAAAPFTGGTSLLGSLGGGVGGMFGSAPSSLSSISVGGNFGNGAYL